MKKNKFKKINKKINVFFKKVNVPFTFISLFLCVIGIVLSYFDKMTLYSNILFILALILCGSPIFYKAIQSLLMKIISIELLVTIAVIGALIIKEYKECGVVTFLFQFGSLLELKTISKTRNEIKSLINMAPKKAIKINDFQEEIDIDEVELNDILLVRTGDIVPVDGTIIKGEGHFNEASINGESIPIKKMSGDFIYGGTILEDGLIEMKAERVGEDTTFAKIIALVEEAEDSKSKIDRFINKFAKWYTPFVIILAILTLLIKWLITRTWDIDTSITILVLACPGALVIGAPIASVAGIGKGAKNHILLKGGDSLQTFSKTNIVMLDKTGTLTKGKIKVISYKYFGDDETKDLRLIQSMEASSSHPLAKAILNYKKQEGITPLETKSIKGIGLQYQDYYLGGEKLLTNYISLTTKEKKEIQNIKENGSTIVLFCKGNRLISLYELQDEIKDEAKEFVLNLQKQGIKKIIMLTGDNEHVAKYVSTQCGIKEYYASLLPEEKVNIIKEYQNKGYVVTFIGDGINDSPSLAFANTGISMGSGTEVAIETSDVVLVKDNLKDVNKALKISKDTIKISIENIIIAILTVIILLIGLFMDFVHMSIGMLIHEGSILVVILNAMRLLINKKEKQK